MARIATTVSPPTKFHGFRNFDDRDLPGSVEGTENPSQEKATTRLRFISPDSCASSLSDRATSTGLLGNSTVTAPLPARFCG